MASILRRSPLLKQGLAEVERRFGHLDGLCGFGVGRKFRDGVDKPGAFPKTTNGLCIRVYVRRKRPKDGLTQRDRIPAWIMVRRKGSRRDQRIYLDVAEVGTPKEEQGTAPPTLGRISVGARFAVGQGPASGSGGPDVGIAEVGTSGCVFEMPGGGTFAVSAAHVFSKVCAGDTTAPLHAIRVGTRGTTWRRVPASAVFPGSVLVGGRVRDAIAMRVLPEWIPTSDTWPLGFQRRFAQTADVQAALTSSAADGSVWVERNRSGAHRVIRLVGDIDAPDLTVKCDGRNVQVPYGFVWVYRFTGPTTRSGDSGASLFVRSATNNEPRLLGFHFLRHGLVGYAVDAHNFFAAVVGKPGRDFRLWEPP